MNKILISLLLIFLLQSCAKKEYMWVQRKVALTQTGYVFVGNWEPLDTTHAQPLYVLKKVKANSILFYPNN